MSALEDLEAGLPPEQLVPGDVDAIERAAAECRTIADKLAETRRNVEYIELQDGDWTGGAAAAYFAVKTADVGVLDVSARAMDVASRALADYAVMLRDARRRAAEALEEYRAGKAAAAASAGAGLPTPALPATPAVPAVTDRTPATGSTWPAIAAYDPLDPTIVPITPTPTQPYQEGPVAKLIAARDDVTRSGTAAADSLHRTREVAPGPSSDASTQATASTPWQTLETGVVALETTATAVPTTEPTTSPALAEEALVALAAGEGTAQGAVPGGGGSAGALTLLSVLAMFGGAGAVAARAARLPGPAALASSMPPSGLGERLAPLGERPGAPGGAAVGQGGLGSALRGAGGRTASGRPGGRLGGGVGAVGGMGARGRRGRGLRGVSSWLDEADLDADAADEADQPDEGDAGPAAGPGAAGGR